MSTITPKQTSILPIEPREKSIFVFHYRARYRPTEDFVQGEDLTEVRRKCIDYCNSHGLTFISVRPFFLDLDRPPRNRQRQQPDEEENKVTEPPTEEATAA